MTATSRELVRAITAAAIEEIGAKKWRRIVRRARQGLMADMGKRGVPEIGARVNAVQVLDSALRLVLLERL